MNEIKKNVVNSFSNELLNLCVCIFVYVQQMKMNNWNESVIGLINLKQKDD